MGKYRGEGGGGDMCVEGGDGGDMCVKVDVREICEWRGDMEEENPG